VIRIVGVPVHFLMHPLLLVLSESVKLNWLIFFPLTHSAHHVMIWSVYFYYASLMLADRARIVRTFEGVVSFLVACLFVLYFVLIKVCLVS